MATKSNATAVQAEELVRQWREARKASEKRPLRQDAVLDRIRERRERIYGRIGELDDSVDLIREDRKR
jgi:hypothetical protein